MPVLHDQPDQGGETQGLVTESQLGSRTLLASLQPDIHLPWGRSTSPTSHSVSPSPPLPLSSLPSLSFQRLPFFRSQALLRTSTPPAPSAPPSFPEPLLSAAPLEIPSPSACNFRQGLLPSIYAVLSFLFSQLLTDVVGFLLPL